MWHDFTMQEVSLVYSYSRKKCICTVDDLYKSKYKDEVFYNDQESKTSSEI